MDVVSARWYRIFNNSVTVFSAVWLAGSLAAILIPDADKFAMRFGLSYITLTLSVILLIYRIFLYGIVERRNSTMVATLNSSFIFMLNLVNLIHSTGRLHSGYHSIWLLLVFMSGIFGPLAIIGFCFLTLLYLLLITTDVPGRIHFDPISLGATAGVFVIGLGAYFFWRRLYINQESAQIAKLSGQLKTKEQQAQILINSITDGMIVTTTDGKISLMNPAAAEMTGWGLDESNGLDVRSVLKFSQENGQDLDAGGNPFTKALDTKQAVNDVLGLESRAGKKIIVSVVISPVILPGDKSLAGSVAIIRDISASRAEEKKRADFISTASHEMRTPVAAIEGYLALAMNEQVASIDSKARSYLEKAHTSTQHLGKLFQDLLTSARAEDGRLVNHPVVVEMGEYLEQLADSLRFAAEKKGLLVDFILGGVQDSENNPNSNAKIIKPLYYVNVDPDRIREVITNIFDNAVKYTETGKVTLGLTGNGEVVQIYIKDTGPGIPAEDIPHLFQKFYRVDSSATRTIGGTGLGLFICRKIIELYGGRIWVESNVGKGSTFYINIPRLSAQQATQLQEADAAKSATIMPPPS